MTDVFLQHLEGLRMSLCVAAQAVYDAWEQDENGWNDELGEGGICDEIADAMSGVVAESLQNVTLHDGGWEGDDHAWIIVVHDITGFRYGVDIDSRSYEKGNGYTWTKIDGVTFTTDNIDIWEIN